MVNKPVTSKKILMPLIILIIISLLLTACGAPQTAEEPTKTETTIEAPTEEVAGEEKITIGVVMLGLTHPYHVEQMEAGTAAAKAYGAEAIYKSSEGDLDTQIALIETFIEQGVDALIVAPVNKDAMDPLVAKAKEAGIPFITMYEALDNPDAHGTPTPDYDNFVKYAEIVGACLNWDADVVMLGGLPGNAPADNRKNGFEDRIAALESDHPNFKLISYQPTDWDPVKAQNVVQDWLTQFSEIDGMVTASDSLMYSAIDLLKAAGREKKTLLFGHDGDVKALELVQDGTFASDVLFGATRLEWFLIRYAIDIVRGKDVPEVVNMPTSFVMRPELAEQCYTNGLSKDITFVTPEEALEVARNGALEFGPDVDVDWSRFVTK